MTLRSQVAASLADEYGTCRRPMMQSVLDRETGRTQEVAIACGSTQESKCPGCAKKAQRLRMHQCREGWHLDQEPEREPVEVVNTTTGSDRRVRSTKRRQDVPDLPKVPMQDRTIGQAFETPDGKTYRPSMFLTLTLPSYGKISLGTGTPVDPAHYDYRRAALDAIFFPRLVDQFWKALRRCAGYDVQYFSAIEPQKRLAPHLHAAIRGAIPRQVLRQVIKAVYLQVWWPRFDKVIYPMERLPIWTEAGYADLVTGELLPTWEEAMDALDDDPRARPVHIMRFGTQTDIKGIVAPSPDADRAVHYLVKYLNKSISEPFRPGPVDGEDGPVMDPRAGAYEAHVDRLHRELRYLPCSESCSNWLRYGIQPDGAQEGMRPGCCPKKHHDREHLGLGGRRCLVSRKWTGKTLKRHKADRAAVVQEVLQAAGMATADIERMAAAVPAADGQPRYQWTPLEMTPGLYCRAVMSGVMEKQKQSAQYAKAKTLVQVAGTNSATPP